MKRKRKRKLWTKGNTKVPFRIVNFGSGTDCPSRLLGFCQIPDGCYATRDEKTYPGCLPYRRWQGKYWQHARVCDVIALAESIEAERQRARCDRMKKKVLRFSEAGDFQNQTQLDVFTQFAEHMIYLGWTVYGYTARRDLDLSKLIKVGVKINLSFDGSKHLKVKTNRFRVVDAPTGSNFVCGGDCSACAVCRSVSGKTIEVITH